MQLIFICQYLEVITFSLPLLPESHLFNEKDMNGAIVNGLKFRVPSILNAFGLNLIRPNLQMRK